MWEIILGGITTITMSLGVYYYLYRYNDNVNELLTFTHNNMKCIKYLYRGNKYIYMTYDLEADITSIQKEIDINSSEKDKLPIVDYKYFKVIITTPHMSNNNLNNNIEENDNEYFNCENNLECEDTNYKEESVHELLLEAPKLLYSFIGPSNTYYFAFDKDFNKKLTIFMNYLFEDEKVSDNKNNEGVLIYSRFSALLEPEKYFDFKVKINSVKKNNSYVNWCIE